MMGNRKYAGYLRHRAALTSLKLFPPKRYEKTVFLAGTGRSGTTWIGNIINYKKDYRVIFEPVHHQYIPEFDHFRQRQYLSPDDHDPAFMQPLMKLVDGDLFNKWSDSRLNAFFPDKLLIKGIRANLLLYWIYCHKPGIKCILLLRHPYDVYHSKVRLGWGAGMSDYLDQPALVRDHLQPYLDTIKTASTNLERITVAWCIENMVPLKQFSPHELLVCHYENFIKDPQREFNILMEFLEEPTGKAPQKIFLKSSDTNWNRTDHTDKQQNKLQNSEEDKSKEELKKINEILAVFGLDKLYDAARNPLPVDADLC